MGVCTYIEIFAKVYNGARALTPRVCINCSDLRVMYIKRGNLIPITDM